MKKLIKLILIISLTYLNPVLAKSDEEIVNKISKNIRCLVCQGQSVYDSQSDFAIGVRAVIEKKINDGSSEEEIYEYLKSKYGEWISYEPKLNKFTYLLWLLPLILFIFGGLLIFKKVFIKT